MLCIVITFFKFINFFVSLFFFVLVAICTWGSTYYRPGPLVQPFLSEINQSQVFLGMIAHAQAVDTRPSFSSHAAWVRGRSRLSLWAVA